MSTVTASLSRCIARRNRAIVAFIRVASYYPVTMFSQVRTLARGSSEAQYCELDVVPGDLNRYTLTGCLPQRSEPLPLAFAIQDGASYAGAILKAELAQAGDHLQRHAAAPNAGQ
ncbi:D-alanyl-D-alanine carboxypeptidase [Klebsiella pneumoniae subsp. pneumoniae]|nr:D-alanyl-D-alanine carboxypeptidase [Klebsiella pneumoniae subsp. pneumoniae]